MWPMLGLLLALVGVALLYYIKRLFTKYVPSVTYNPQGRAAKVMDHFAPERFLYHPHPLLFNPHVHTIYGMRNRPRSRFEPEREIFAFADGGVTALDWFHPEEPKENLPLVIAMHTFCGGTREPCTNQFCRTIQKRGWRSVVANCRGCSGAPMLTARLFNVYEIDDLQAIIAHARATYKPSHVFLAGFSLGGYEIIQYAQLDGSVDAAAMVSHTYDTTEGNRIINSWPASELYTKFMMAKCNRMVQKNKFIHNEAAAHAKRIIDFDTAFTVPSLGLKDVDEYYENILIYPKITAAKCLCLILASDDDPFTLKKLQPVKETQESENVVLMSYPEGGHVSFLKGDDWKTSMIDDILPEWFQAVIDSKLN